MLWRSIFEIEVNMQYIARDETDSLAERFVDWGRASYLRLNQPESEELRLLECKYPKPNKLDLEMGWTNPTSPMGVPRRAKAMGYGDIRRGREIPVLYMYEESCSYIHNDAMAIANDLGNNHPIKKGPSVSGLDMPLCLTSRSTKVANDVFMNCQSEEVKAELQTGVELLWQRHQRVLVEVAMVPSRLLSRFGGIDMTRIWPAEDGGALVAIPYRRESTSEEMLQRFLSRHRESEPHSEQ